MRKRYLLAGVLSIVLLFSGCNPLAIKPWERKKLYAYYSNDANYVTVKGKITYNNAANEKRYLSLEIDEEQYLKDYEELLPNNYGRSNYFEIEAANEKILEKNGFYEKMDSDTEIEFITSFLIWWDGWYFPIVGAKIEDTVYLSYEEGKTNFLYHIQYEMR